MMVPAINTSRPCRGCSDDTEEISLNEGLASTGIVFHRHQLKHMATSLPSPGALKELASVCNCNTEICSPLVLRPEPKKIKDDTSSRASVKSTSKEFDEADDNYDVIEESAKEYSGKQYCMDVGRRSTTTTSGAGEECLFLFEEQGCYEEVVICTLPVSDVAGAPRCSASLHSAFYTVNLSGQLAAPGFLESGQAEVLSTAKLADCLFPAIQCAFPIVDESNSQFLGILGINRGRESPLTFLAMCKSFSIPSMLNVDGFVYPTDRSRMSSIQLLPPWDDPRQTSVHVFHISSKEAMLCGGVRSCRKFSPLLGRLPLDFIPKETQRVQVWAFVGPKLSSPNKSSYTFPPDDQTSAAVHLPPFERPRDSIAVPVKVSVSLSASTGEIRICDIDHDDENHQFDIADATTILMSELRYRVE